MDSNPNERGGSVGAVLDLSLLTERQGADGRTIQSWQLLDRLIPRGGSKTVAYYMHCATKYVQAWRRECDSGSGQPNPIDRLCHLIEAIFLVNPLGASHVVEFITNFHRQLVGRHQAVGFGGSEARRDETAELLKAATNAVNSLNTVAATDEALFSLVELRERCDRAIAKVQGEIVSRAAQSRSRLTEGHQ